jgi:hypothetical protein
MDDFLYVSSPLVDNDKIDLSSLVSTTRVMISMQTKLNRRNEGNKFEQP